MDLEKLKQRYPDAVTFTFGDSPELCHRLLELIRSGKKVATCEALRTFERGDEAIPAVGRQDIALNWDGSPAMALETVSVQLTRFCDVEESFALAEGEDETLEGWQDAHRGYFERSGGFDPEMMLVCERFRLIEDFGRPKQALGGSHEA